MKIHLLAAALMAALSAAVAAQGVGACVVQSVDGRATVFAPGAGRHDAVVGLLIGANATLRTRAETRVTLLCPDNLRVVVGPATEISVARLVSGGPRPVALRLMRGIAGFLFDGEGDGVQVSTPSAVAAVRSTEWALRVQGGATAAFAREGAVFVVGDTGTVRLGAGDGVDVTPGGEVGAVVQWGQARIDLFAQLLGADW